MKILCVGEATFDINYLVNDKVFENAYLHADNKTECGGGVSSNIAYLLAKWKMESYFVGTIGKDNNGKEILKEFNEVGVNTNFLEIDKKIQTSSNVILTNTDDFTSTVINYNTNEEMVEQDIDITPDVIVFDGTYKESSFKILNQFPKAKSFLNLTRFTKEDLELVKRVDYVVCTSDFASRLTNLKINYKNTNSLITIYEKLNSVLKNLIITLDDIGCLYELDNTMKIMPFMKVNRVDNTSSDDIFLGAFIYGLTNKFDIEKSLKYANIARSLSLTKLGGRTSIPTLEEVEDVYATLK